MIVRQYAPCNLGRNTICLGKQGEINALRVEFDVSAWMAMYPDATVKLMHFAPDRPQDNPVIPTLGVEGTTRVWIVGEDDTASAGNGVIELLLIDERTGSTIKSATGYTTVLHSPSAGIEAQEAEAGYVRYDVDQSALLTDEQKAMARKNIGAGTGDGTGSGTGGITVEKDPTVPAWAKQPNKPTYTAGEVGARPDTWMPSASEVGADAAGTAAAQVVAHNVSGEAHADLRALIDAVTTGKVSTSDIVDNLTTNASGKVLSAAQGVALKGLIDAIVIPDKLPNPQPLTINGQSYDGSDAVTVTTAEIDDTLTQSGKAADAKAVGDRLTALNEANAAQDTEIAKKANDADLAKVAKSGSYDDLTGKPTIPTVPSALPNPNALTFTGAVNETYDGSTAKSVAIPTVPESLKNPNKLTFTGAVTAEYDGSTAVEVTIPEGGSGSYTLPIASPTTLGGVMPVAKTDEMTQAVGVDAEGKLFTAPGSGGGETLTEEETVLARGTIAAESLKGTYETGLTIGDFRKWKTFSYQIKSGKAVLFGINLGNVRLAYESQLYMSSIFTFIDHEKKVLRADCTMSGQGGTTPGTSMIKSMWQGSFKFGGQPSALIGKLGADSDKLTLNITADLTADMEWEFRGLIK